MQLPDRQQHLSYLRDASCWLWRLGLAILLLAVLAVAAARLIITYLPQLQPHLITFLDNRYGLVVTMAPVAADWQGGNPRLTVQELTVQGRQTKHPGLTIDHLTLTLNLGASLLHLTPVFDTLIVDRLSLAASQAADSQWTFLHPTALPNKSDQAIGDVLDALAHWLHWQQQLVLTQTTLNMIRSDGSRLRLSSPNITLHNDNGLKTLAAHLAFAEGVITVAAQATGRHYWDHDWHGSLSVQGVDLALLNALIRPDNNNLQTALANVELTWHYHNGVWQIAGGLSVPAATYRSPTNNQCQLTGHTDLFFNGPLSSVSSGRPWQLWLHNVFLDSHQHEPIQGNGYLASTMAPEHTITLASDSVDLAPLTALLLDLEGLPPSAQPLLRTLNPRGQLRQLAFRLYPDREPFDFDLIAQLQNVTINAWEGAPSADHVSGQLRMRRLTGALQLDSHDFGLGLTRTFRDVWHFDTAKAQFYWQVTDDTFALQGDTINLRGAEGTLAGQLHLTIPRRDNPNPATMGLIVGIRDGDARYTSKYLPAKAHGVSPALIQWLDRGIKNGHINAGGFVYNGVLSPTAIREATRWGLYFDIDDSTLNYHPDWPSVSDITGQVFVNNDQVEVLAHSGLSLGAKLSNVSVTVPLKLEAAQPQAAGPVLYIRGNAQTTNDTVFNWLTKTPIHTVTGHQAKDWELQGDINAQLQLTIPIDRPENAEVTINADVNNGLFGLPAYHLRADRIHGNITFSTNQGLTADHLDGQLLGQPVTAAIISQLINDKPQAIHLQWQGNIAVADLQPWLPVGASKILTGMTHYATTVTLHPNSATTAIHLTSPLTGIAIDLPAPLGKPAAEAWPLVLDYTLVGTDQHLAMTLAELGQVNAKIGPAFSVDDAVVVLGKPMSTLSPLPATDSQGIIRITGQLPTLDIHPWHQRLQQYAAVTEHPAAEQIMVDNLHIGLLQYHDQYRWQDVAVSYKTAALYHTLTVASEPLQGRFGIPKRPAQPYTVALTRLRWPECLGDREQTTHAEAPQANAPTNTPITVQPTGLPAANIAIQSLQIDGQDRGAVAFELRPRSDGTDINGISAQLSGMQLTGSAQWTEQHGQQHTALQGELRGKTIDALQTSLHKPAFIQARNSHITAFCNWPGAPWQPRLADITGTLKLAMQTGRLKTAESSADALKLFGLFNIVSLTRRLKLDFSDLYASGISFDQLSGKLQFSNGIITLSRPLTIEGPSSDFKLEGRIDTHQEIIDARLVVTFPVMPSLPILSVLLGVAPQVAGIIYLADKLVGKQVDNRLASIRYHITGPLSDPQVIRDKQFANKATKPDSAAKK